MTLFYEVYKKEGLSSKAIAEFRKLVYDYYLNHRRTFPWREDPSPYKVFISEIMLQQTQAGKRTVAKFNEFLQAFPHFESLAKAPINDLLRVWQGLGYNRRALGLKKAAEIIVHEHKGVLPSTLKDLDDLPGIGPATASSISAFAFNLPVTFIETNIRSLYIHFFFPDAQGVSDSELLPFVEATLDYSNPREWYSALMDYGSMLKKQIGNTSVRSKHYSKQSAFEGSDRQLRGLILKALITSPLSKDQLLAKVSRDRTLRIAETLIKEGFIAFDGDKYSIIGTLK